MITECIQKGLSFLEKEQQENGSFLNLSSPDPTDFKKALRLHPTFPTAIILACLSSLPSHPQTQRLKEKAASFLLAQKSTYWSFNYWDRASEEAKTMPYPDDLDDTFYALAALFHHDPQLFDGNALACIVSVLTSLEITEGGPYRTWMVTEDAPDTWKDVDLAVNSNIAYFLSLLDISMPNLHTFIEKAVHAKILASPYYYTDYPLLYFISRFYQGKHVKRIQTVLRAKKTATNGFGNPLHTALALTALLNLGVSARMLTKEIASLLDWQKSDGSWDAYGFYSDPSRQGKKYYAGSRALTTAFCLEALNKYLQAHKKEQQEKTNKHHGSRKKKLHKKIVQQTKDIFSFSEALQKKADTIMAILLRKDKQQQITLLPYYLRESLGDKGTTIPNSMIVTLGTASLLGWIAYTIYDDILDEEADPTTLSVATCALRELTTRFTTLLPQESGFTSFFCDIMNELDTSNLWEVTNCRIRGNKKILNIQSLPLPDFGGYERLASRSLGHALAPLALLFFVGYDKESSEVKNVLTFFSHYIIAKQLLDDAHDYEKDLQNGTITPVVAALIQTMKKTHEKISLPSSMPVIHELFWYDVVTAICEEIIRQSRLAREAIQNVSVLEDTSLFEELTSMIEASAQKALTEREHAISFLQSYKE